MASKLLRRSGVAIGKVARLLDWRPDLVVQVGVGGHHEEVAVMQELWPGVRFVGFEGHPLLAANLAGEYPGDMHPYAISDYNGAGTFWCKRRHKDGSSLKLHEAERGKYEGVEIQVRQLDDFCAVVEAGRVLLWLDCEGSEGAALRGGPRFLERVDVVNVEMTAAPYNDEWDKPDEIHDLLTGHGYIRQWIHTQRCEQGQYDGIYVKPHLFKPQYCCDPLNTRR